MKKISMMMMIFIMALVLTGCGNSKTLKCTKEETYTDDDIEKAGYEVKLVFDKEGNNLNKYTSIAYAVYSSNISNKDFDTEYDDINSSCDSYEKYTGVTCKPSKKGYKMQLTVDFDFNKTNDETNAAFGFEDLNNMTYDGMKLEAEEMGYTCK